MARGALLKHLIRTVFFVLDLYFLFWTILSWAVLRWRSITLIKMQLHYLVFLLYHLFRLVRSIEVTPQSKCSWICVDDIGKGDKANDQSSMTVSSDVVCEDYQLAGPNSTDKGRKWKDCLTCELTSKAVDPSSNENELYWILCKLPVWKTVVWKVWPRKCVTDISTFFFAVNLRFSFAACVFAYPPDNQNLTDAGKFCAETCQGPNNVGEAALVNKLLVFNISAQYQYCETENRAFPRVADDCIKCLKKVPNSNLMVNCKYYIPRNLELDRCPAWYWYTMWHSRRQSPKRGLHPKTRSWGNPEARLWFFSCFLNPINDPIGSSNSQNHRLRRPIYIRCRGRHSSRES